MFIIISGVAVIAFATSIVVSAFTEQLDGIKEQKMISDISKMKHFYLICGYSEVAEIVTKRLRNDGIPFVILEKDHTRMMEAVKAKMPVILTDPAKKDSYENYGINVTSQVISVLCLENSDVQTIYTALTIRSINPNIPILSYLHEGKNRKKLSLAGSIKLFILKNLLGSLPKSFTGKPVAFDAIHVLRSRSTDIVMDEIIINERILSDRSCVG